ncbi:MULTISPECIES: multidrug effflux MFS transporter [Campylobacter]|uniref:multidrug effflux MFS transporter n=1 Tax=Campylobacter TaxID=194 RepID=UPI000A35BA07|nr:multidrug effflux MFS transporter [Campylobacter sp. P0024]MCR8679655.1 multidrug effflux MFS transporter [Campylobacter sp. RM19072]
MQSSSKIHGFSKFKLIIILAFMSSIAPLSTDMYLPALSHVQSSFEASEFLTQLSLASFFIAFAFGQLIYGPLSDIFGRKMLLIIGILIFIASSLGCVMVDNIYVFITLRFFEALGGCAGVVIARAIVNDNFDIKDAAGIYALMMVFSSLAPMLSPTFGGILLRYFSWQSIFAVLFMLGILLLLFIIFGLKESMVERVKFSHKATINSYKFVLKEPIFILYCLIGALASAVLFAYITGSSFVFMGYFGLDETKYGILFGVNSFSFVLFANINARFSRKFDCEILLKFALIAMLVALIFISFAAFIQLGFWAFEVGVFIAIGMLEFILPNSTTLAMARFKDHSGTASAVLGVMQFGLAGVIAFGVGVLEANTPLFLALVMLVPCVIAVILRYKHTLDR